MRSDLRGQFINLIITLNFKTVNIFQVCYLPQMTTRSNSPPQAQPGYARPGRDEK